jgi:outer membrane protein assembly factor BamA
MVPYLYWNMILPGVFNTEIKMRDKIRSSVGLGISWITIFGKVNFNYAAKTFSKVGDVETEFQVLFSD